MEKLNRCPANYVPLTPIVFLERAGSVYRERTSIIYGSVRFTWEETLDRCIRLASSLSSLNISKGDVVAVVAPNIPAMYELQFAAPMAGAVLCCLNIRHDAHTMSVLLQHSAAKILFVDHQFADVVHNALHLVAQNKAPLPTIIAIPELAAKPKASATSPEFTYEGLVSSGDKGFKPRHPDDEWETIALNYTSGTTASPKGVLFSHRGAYLNALASVLMWEMKALPVFLWVVPLFHSNGWCYAWATAAQGGANVCLRHVTARAIFDAIVAHHVTHMAAAPTVLNMVCNAREEEKRRLPHTVHVNTGGAPPPPRVLAAMGAMGFHVIHSYGLTETYAAATSCVWKPEWDTLADNAQSRLRARQGVKHLGLYDVDVKNPQTLESVRHDGKTLGEVMIRGNTVMKGYVHDVAATEAAFHGGWFHTGDLGVMHPDGYVELKDRSKDIIISGGENISSIELESVLYGHPDVVEAAVVGRPDEYWGETPCAFVKVREGREREVREESIIGFCREKLPHFMTPKTVVFQELPKSSTGKVQKVQLKQQAKAMGSLYKGSKSKL